MGSVLEVLRVRFGGGFVGGMFCVLSLLLLVSGVSVADEIKLTKEVQPHLSSTLRLPESWVQIPPRALAEVSRQIREVMSHDAPQGHYEAGYQAGGAPWFSYPYFLVQVVESGRVPEEDLKKLKSFKSSIDRAGERLSERHLPLAELSVGESLYDADSQIIWGSMSSVVAGVGRVRSLNAVVLTAKGAVNIYTYSKEEDYDDQVKVFERIIRSLRLKPGLEYTNQL